jgi:hypothetical protein
MMKQINISFLSFLLLWTLAIPRLSGQSILWSEDFSNGCPALCTTYTGTNGVWTVSNTDINGVNSNNWFFSSAENGNPAGLCSSTSGIDQSLHIGNVSSSTGASLYCPSGDCGATYDDSDSSEATNKRAESPVINCSGFSNINLSFNYIENGETSDDDGSLWYFDGSVWTLLSNTTKTLTCAVYRSTWTAFSIQLPVTANNNPNVKIGFNWTNDGDGNATDPSFAIDDIVLSQGSVGIEELQSNIPDVKIYPNPFLDLISIDLDIKEDCELKLEIVDILGNVISTLSDEKKLSGIYHFEFNATQSSPGIYFLKLRTGDSTLIRKLILTN